MVAALLAAAVTAAPGGAETRPEGDTLAFAPPERASVEDGKVVVRWSDVAADGLDEGIASITWYYSRRADGADRKRVTSIFREDFRDGNFLRNWRPSGQFGLEWAVSRDRQRGAPVLTNRTGGTPIYSQGMPDRDSVVSVLVRPQGLNNQFSLGLRTQPDGRGYRIRTDGNQVRIERAGRVIAEETLALSAPRSWAWYEVGVRTRQKREVEIRVRVLDESRQRVLASLDCIDCPPQRELCRPGLIALWGPADVAEVYADPWAARWTDDGKNEFTWDTSEVAEGDYYLIAEVVDGKNGLRRVTSDFQVKVRRAEQAAAQ